MKIAHLCMTPIAGAAWSWSEAFREAGHESFSCTPTQYKDGRVMPSDCKYPPGNKDLEVINQADVIFCHLGHPYAAKWYPKDKPTVVIYYNQPVNADRQAEREGWPWGVVGQYPTRLYDSPIPVPNLIPLKHPWYQPGDKPTDRVRIAFSPSNINEGGWNDKGHAATVGAIEDLDAELDVIRGVSLEDCLRRKSTAHIVIDECVTGSYHRSSLEALALGCMVVNNCDNLCIDNIKRMTDSPDGPFWVRHITHLRTLIKAFIEKGPEQLAAWGGRGRDWIDRYWLPADLITRNLAPLMSAAFDRAKHGMAAV